MALPDQMIRAARLDTSLYEEVEADTNQTNNAIIIVVVAAVAAGIGQAIAAANAVVNPAASGVSPVTGLLGGLIAALVVFAIWTGLVYFVGTRIFGGTATWGEVLRTVGFANSPGVLNILAFIPGLGTLVSFVVWIWVLVATVIAVRQALDVGTGRAILAALIGGIPAIIISGIVLGIFGISAMMAMPAPTA